MAICLQKFDNLKTSKYLEKLLEEEVEGNVTIKEVEKELKNYIKIMNITYSKKERDTYDDRYPLSSK